jgi:CHAD domain-containing protein
MRKYARSQTSILLGRLAFEVNRASRSSEPDAVHDLRVAIRRLSRALRVFAHFFPDGSWKKSRHALTALMKAAGRVRDRDIALDLLRQCGISPRAAISRRLAADRIQAGRDLVAEIRRLEHRDFSRKWRGRLEL